MSSTGTDAAIEAVEECGRLGVKVATVLADGFTEAGAEGDRARGAAARRSCAETGIRVVGPSSLGVVDLRTSAMLTANAAFDEPDLPVGRIFAASHSGSMIGSIFRAARRAASASPALVSVGNEVDLSLGEICEATLDDPGIDGYMLFLETMRNADALRALRARCGGSAASRSSPTSSAARRRRASSRCRTPARSPARTTSPTCSSPNAASPASMTLDGLIEGLPLLARMPAAAAQRQAAAPSPSSPPRPAAPPWWSIR